MRLGVETVTGVQIRSRFEGGHGTARTLHKLLGVKVAHVSLLARGHAGDGLAGLSPSGLEQRATMREGQQGLPPPRRWLVEERRRVVEGACDVVVLGTPAPGGLHNERNELVVVPLAFVGLYVLVGFFVGTLEGRPA